MRSIVPGETQHADRLCEAVELIGRGQFQFVGQFLALSNV